MAEVAAQTGLTACHSWAEPVVKVEEAVWDVSEVGIEIVWVFEGDFVEVGRGAG